jgi:hypothetical protein
MLGAPLAWPGADVCALGSDGTVEFVTTAHHREAARVTYLFTSGGAVLMPRRAVDKT